MSELELTVAIAISVDKMLARLEQQRCNEAETLINKPWSIPVVCNRIRGHVEKTHSDGMSVW